MVFGRIGAPKEDRTIPKSIPAHPGIVPGGHVRNVRGFGLFEQEHNDLAVIDEDLLAEWFHEAGLRRVVSSRLPGSPFPVVLCLARRLAQDEEAAA